MSEWFVHLKIKIIIETKRKLKMFLMNKIKGEQKEFIWLSRLSECFQTHSRHMCSQNEPYVTTTYRVVLRHEMVREVFVGV